MMTSGWFFEMTCVSKACRAPPLYSNCSWRMEPPKYSRKRRSFKQLWRRLQFTKQTPRMYSGFIHKEIRRFKACCLHSVMSGGSAPVTALTLPVSASSYTRSA